ncbi:MAG: amidophosphoribosyltransferase [Candidatus Cloacimonetes bacterium]|nr:amidophosphoribosyltransferase [Candidatus Cloacimonadota bacterium]MCF7813561.1 amidophosphoribosyltransferase [Candidatus Cloacimonadota bacterium]MCF7868192.1 amidophosphoribosyltransferase [Candidatus Cloacimonadota bacterium]MCF7883644.1 amidophosphoribosyltransferase [Candidatus Cloacimonadota bacterium]
MCGIIGIYNSKNAAELATLGLFAEQHRGQESCGMAVNDGTTIRLRKKMGLVKDVFTSDKLQHLPGEIAIGHVRYPTRGASSVYNSQPHVVETLSGPSYALASNGDIINYKEIRKFLEDNGVYFASSNDGELLLKYIVYHVEKEDRTIIEAIKLLMKYVKGAFSTVLATKTEMFLFRDPYGLRPITYGKTKEDAVAVASESCALDILYMDWVKEVQPAEIIRINKDGIETFPNDPNKFRATDTNKHCIFEHIYFSRPDSINYGENVFEVREKIGAKLAEADEITPDTVVPVPDSSNFIALGYAKQKNVPFEMGLIRNHYVGRTFIKPEQTIRDESVYQKFNVLPDFFKDKIVVLIDDSIVRGTTIRKLVKLIKKAGAKEVHIRIGSPAVKFSCYYGIDTPTREELIANEMDVAGIEEYTGADSLKYLEIEDLETTVSKPQDYCYACFSGNYPVK